MLIGLDFDNTIVCYDAVFEWLAREKGVPPAVAAAGKTAIRDFLRAEGRESDWTTMQGQAYGSRMREAVAYAWIGEFLYSAAAAGHRMVIVSHRTLQPYLGPAFDLHAAARAWWAGQEFATLVAEVHFETTAEAKAARIGALQCEVFVDDLWEFLQRSDLPSGLRKIWLDHGDASVAKDGLERVSSWREVAAAILT